jgi:hypothetical protein
VNESIKHFKYFQNNQHQINLLKNQVPLEKNDYRFCLRHLISGNPHQSLDFNNAIEFHTYKQIRTTIQTLT